MQRPWGAAAMTLPNSLLLRTARQRSIWHYLQSCFVKWGFCPNWNRPGQHEINDISRNRRIRDLYVQWCGRDGP